MRRLVSAAAITAYLVVFVQSDQRSGTLSAQIASGDGAGDLRVTLALEPAPDRQGGRGGGLSRPASAGQPSILDSRSPLSAAVMAAVGGRGTQFSEVALFGDWDGREDATSDRSQKVDDFSFVEPDVDFTLTRTAVSAHTAANGFAENVYYYGDSVGNVWVGVDSGPGTSSDAAGSVDAVVQLNLPTLLNAFGSISSDDQVVITGVCVSPVTDLTSFANVNGAYAPFSGQIGEMLYVTFLDTGGGIRLAANNILVKSGLLAFPIADTVSPAAAPPAIQSGAGFPVTVGGAFGVAFSVFHNLAGCAVDDDGSVYFQQVDLTQFAGANIVKVTDVGANQDRSLAVSGILTLTTLNPSGRVYGTASGPATQVNRFTNFSGTSTTFGNIAALAAGPENTVFAAVAASNDSTAGSGLFANPAGLGVTPSMIVSFADAIGQISPAAGVIVADGLADAASGAGPGTPGVDNFRVFALGAGPERRGAAGQFSPVFGTVADTLKLDFQIDYTIYSGLAVNEDRQVFIIAGGTPAGVGRNPSPLVTEILAFPDTFPADRRADFVDRRGNSVPNPPQSGGNVGDGDSDRFDHLFLQAPIDGVVVAPTGLAGLSRGFLRYTNRLAPTAMSAGVTLGQTAGATVQGDNQFHGPIFFGGLDPGFQAGGGDDQNPPFRGDDSDGGGFPAIAGPREGGFEFSFGAIVGGVCTAPWNAFFLSSNGSVSFSAGTTDGTPTTAELLAGPPRIAGAWGDLNPGARVGGFLNQFPVQAVGYAGINHFKVRWINVPRAGQEGFASRSTFSISLFDDGTGGDENANQALNPANPIGNNTVPFDLQEGPTDLQFTLGPAGIIGNPPRPSGSSQIRLEYGWMDSGVNLDGFIAGYSTAPGAGIAEMNLSEIGRSTLIGVGVEPAVFEQFSANDWDLRAEGNDAVAATPAGQPNANLGVASFLGKACAAPSVNLNVAVTPSGGGSVAGTGIACPTDCVGTFASGSSTILTATPAPDFIFSNWSGCDAPAGNVCTMFMSGPKQVAANFALPPQPFQVSLNGSAFSTGQTLVATVTLNPTVTGASPVDLYFVVEIPGGAMFSLQLPIGANRFVPGVVPIVSGLVLFPITAPVLAVPLPAIPAGTYTIRTFATQPGTMTVVGAVSSASFTFTP